MGETREHLEHCFLLSRWSRLSLLRLEFARLHMALESLRWLELD